MKMIKLLFVFLVTTSSQAFALNMVPNAPSTEELMKIVERVSPIIVMMKDITGLYFGACETKTGKSIDTMNTQEIEKSIFEPCFHISASSQESVDALKVLYPPGKKIQSIDSSASFPSAYFIIDKHGAIVAQ